MCLIKMGLWTGNELDAHDSRVADQASAVCQERQSMQVCNGCLWDCLLKRVELDLHQS